tara:strand:+ start:5642 stop:6139 length:498 start_codon:yes stop_codon:yes gene_type:complete
MIKLTIIFSALFAVNATAIPNKNLDNLISGCEFSLFEASLCTDDSEVMPTTLDWSSIELFEIEEEVNLGFNSKDYLPKGFNPLKGLHDLDWSSIELFEIEEEVNLGFDTKDYLPEHFNPLKGLHDLDWDTIELFEIEEEVELCFNTKDYLPRNFNANINLSVSEL